MKVIDISWNIGNELRKTKEGKETYDMYMTIKNKLSSSDWCIYDGLIDKHHSVFHFQCASIALLVLQNNIENEVLGNSCRQILTVPEVSIFASLMHEIEMFVEGISTLHLHPTVRYQLPSGVSATPKLIRLVQDLSVAMQELEIVKDILVINEKDKSIISGLSKEFTLYEQEKGIKRIDSTHIYLVHDLVGKGYVEKDAMTVFKLMLSISYIGLAVFYGFFDVCVTIKECDFDDWIVLKDDTEADVKASCQNGKFFDDAQQCWILCVVSTENKHKHYLITAKTIDLMKMCTTMKLLEIDKTFE